MMKTENRISSILKTAENMFKSTLSAGAIIYAWGFLIVSVYLSQFNVLSMNLLRVQYVLAGIWFFVPIIIFLVFVIVLAVIVYDEFFYLETKLKKPKGVGRFLTFIWKLFWIYIFIIGFLGLVGMFLKSIAPNFTSSFNSIDRSNILYVAGFCLAIVVLTGLVWFLFKVKKEDSEDERISSRLWGTLYALFAVVVIFGYTLYFSLNLYPKIPAVLGGAQPLSVKIMVIPGIEYDSVRAELNFDDNQELSPTLKLITTTDDSYIILDPTNVHRVIVLPKNYVSLIIFESE